MTVEEVLQSVALEAGTTYYVKVRNLYVEVKVFDENHPDPRDQVIILDTSAARAFQALGGA